MFHFFLTYIFFRSSIVVLYFWHLFAFQDIYYCLLFLLFIYFSRQLLLSYFFYFLYIFMTSIFVLYFLYPLYPLILKTSIIVYIFYLLPFCKKNNRKSSGLFSARIRFWDIYPHLHFLTPSDPLLPSIPSLFQIPTNFYKHISLVFHTASLYFFALLQSSFLGIFCLPKTI